MSRPQSIFATLTPENTQAQKCLESLVEKHGVRSLSTSLPGVRINPNLPKHSRRSSQSRYQLVLSLDTQGAGQGGPWTVGKLGPKSVGIDLPICSIRSRQFQGTKVCKIYIHPQSYVLMLQNLNETHPITYLLGHGNADAELQYGDTHVIHMKINHLRIGPLDFVLEFSVEDVGAFAASRRTYMQRHLHQDAGPDCDEDQEQGQGHSYLDPLPTREQLHIRDVILHHTVGKGAFGLVMVGVDRWSGDMVACKMIHCGDHDKNVVNNEVLVASRIPLNMVGLVPLLSSWCEHGQSPACFQSVYETVYMIMPYAPFAFSTMAWRKVASATRLALFRQVLEGLRNLHAMGIMHRDISPRNLLVFSLAPPQAAICDYGKSKDGTKGHQAALGPQGFTAPEVGGPAGHTSAIDVFSLGLSLLATFGRWPGWNKSLSSRDAHQLVLQHLAGLEGGMPDGLGALLRSMLAWDPADRPTAEDALAHQVWEQVVVAGSAMPSSTTSSGSSSSGNAPGSSTAAVRRRRSGGMSRSGSRGINIRMRGTDALPPPPPLCGSKMRQSAARGSGVGRMKESGITRTSGSESLLSPPPA